jgi:hypothetical protein
MNEYIVEPEGLGTWKSTRSKDDSVLISGVSEEDAIEAAREIIRVSGRKGEVTILGNYGQAVLCIPVTV